MKIKEIFNGKTFSHEQEAWSYIITLRDHVVEEPDGIYLFHGPLLIESLSYTGYFKDQKTYWNETRGWVVKVQTAFYVEIREGHFRYFSFWNKMFDARQEKKNGVWETGAYEDKFETDFYIKKKFTQQEIREACNSLVDAMVVNLKKIN